MRRKSGLLLWLLLLQYGAFAQSYHFTFDKECAEAYRQILSLKIREGNTQLNAIARKDPRNFIPYLLADYSDCIDLLFNGDARKLGANSARVEKRLELLERADAKSPWYRYAHANICFHQALVSMRFGDNFKAATRLRKSFQLLRDNLKLFPGFEENKVLLGLQTASAGAIPDSHKWLAGLMGIKGDIRKGIAMLSAYRDAAEAEERPLYREALIFEVYLRFYLLGEQENAWSTLLQKTASEPANWMYGFLKTNLALNYRKATFAQSTLASLERSAVFSQYPIFLYERAEALSYELNPRCGEYYLNFLKAYKGTAFVKDTYLKLALMQILENNKRSADAYLELLRQTGNTLVDADKQAQRFTEKPVWPLRSLLETRLLIDGGYYLQALEKIKSIKPESLIARPDQIEYLFRYGRVLEELNEKEKAIDYYTRTIEAGKSEKLYFAARAALQQGLIYERNGKKEAARERYRFCLSLRNHDLQSSIDQLAKAGLNRLGD